MTIKDMMPLEPKLFAAGCRNILPPGWLKYALQDGNVLLEENKYWNDLSWWLSKQKEPLPQGYLEELNLQLNKLRRALKRRIKEFEKNQNCVPSSDFLDQNIEYPEP
jgi:hypothetical protein